MYIAIILLLHLTAALIPLNNWQTQTQVKQSTFIQWPEQFQGLPITPLPMTDKEIGFSQGFPGKIGRFSDGKREIIFRYIDHLSRKVHPSADCLRGAGYQVEPQAISRDKNQQLWGCVIATQGSQTYRVCERIHDQSGNSWYDTSSWFWSVLLKNSQGPWWAITVAEQI